MRRCLEMARDLFAIQACEYAQLQAEIEKVEARLMAWHRWKMMMMGGVGWYEDKGASHLDLLATEAPIARLKPTGVDDEVRIAYWSHRRKWEGIDDMGGCVLLIDQALSHVANNSLFWTWT
jgi:hypothetical protein